MANELSLFYLHHMYFEGEKVSFPLSPRSFLPMKTLVQPNKNHKIQCFNYRFLAQFLRRIEGNEGRNRAGFYLISQSVARQTPST